MDFTLSFLGSLPPLSAARLNILIRSCCLLVCLPACLLVRLSKFCLFLVFVVFPLLLLLPLLFMFLLLIIFMFLLLLLFIIFLLFFLFLFLLF